MDFELIYRVYRALLVGISALYLSGSHTLNNSDLVPALWRCGQALLSPTFAI